MASAPGRLRLGAGAVAVLDVSLRVPAIFIIDAIFNSYYEPGSGWAEQAARLAVRVTGILISSMVLVLSQKALFKFYRLFLSILLAVTAMLINTSTSHRDVSRSYLQVALLPRPGPALWLGLLPRPGPALWLGVAAVQLTLAVGYVFLLQLQSVWAWLVVLDVMIPLWGLMLELPGDARQLLSVFSGLTLGLNTAVCLVLRLKGFYYSCRYVYLLLRHMYRIYGLQLLLEDTWKRIRFPDVLRVFWLTRVSAQAAILFYVVTRGDATHGSAASNPQDVMWDLCSNLVISGCDSTLTVLGMSAVISSAAHYLGLSILSFIGSTEEEDKRLGFVAPVLFFILALQTGLSSLDPEERLVRLSRNMCLLLTAILHFVHGMTEPVLMSLSASHVSSPRRHAPVLTVSLALLLLPVALSHALWHHYALNTWLFAVTAFCVELCLKVVVSLTVYTLFMLDGFYAVLWEKLDDYVYYVRSSGNVMEFLFGLIMFGNGAYTMMFESGSKIRACMMCLHAYFNIYLQARNGWKTFSNRRTAVKKINSLPEAKGERLRDIEDVCAICYQEFSVSARITPCQHYFHALCLRKWLYIQDTCPMCHQRVYIEEEGPHDGHAHSNNNAAAGGGANEPEHGEEEPEAEPAHANVDADANANVEPNPGPEEDLLEDNDSIEYDEEEWGTSNAAIPVEEDYINDDTDSTGD